MTDFNFPTNPQLDDEHTQGDTTYIWDGIAWNIIGPDIPVTTIEVENTVTGLPGTEAIVENVGTPTTVLLDFTIPRGDKGFKGEVGPRGVKGFKGEVGQKGQKGEIGQKGQKGLKGEKGQKGTKGEIGQKGEIGIGLQGIKGDQGYKGDAGVSNNPGPPGPTGAGVPGPTGAPGPAGVSNNPGPQGPPGIGSPGTPGTPGSNGGPGPQGSPGPKGAQGPAGSSGDIKDGSLNIRDVRGTIHTGFTANAGGSTRYNLEGGVTTRNSPSTQYILKDDNPGWHTVLQYDTRAYVNGSGRVFSKGQGVRSLNGYSIDEMSFEIQKIQDASEPDTPTDHVTGIWADIAGKTYFGARSLANNGWFFSFNPLDGTSKIRTLNSGSSHAQPIALSADGTVHRCTSVRADKTDIVDYVEEQIDNIISNLRPVVYKDINAPVGFENDEYIGLIAEEVYDVDPRLTVNDVQYEFNSYGDQVLSDTKKPRTVRYDRLVLPLLLSHRKQKQRIDDLEQQLIDLKTQLGL